MKRQQRPTSAIRERFAANLRRLRSERPGLSQRQLARISGLHLSEVSLLERGIREPELGTVVKLAAGLDAGIDELTAGINWRWQEGNPEAGAFFVDNKVS